MKFVVISDTHGRHRFLRLPKADVLLHAGDITYHGDRREVEDFLNWFGNLPHPHKIFVAGNHDFFFEKEKLAIVKKMMPPGVQYLMDEGVLINGIKIWGSPYTPKFYRWAFNKGRGEPLAEQWKKIPSDVDLLLTHGPVYGILDLTANEQHAGDKDLLTKVLAVKPKVHVSGHIHESAGLATRHGIKFINACVLNESYEMVHKPVQFELKPNPVQDSEHHRKKEA